MLAYFLDFNHYKKREAQRDNDNLDKFILAASKFIPFRFVDFMEENVFYSNLVVLPP